MTPDQVEILVRLAEMKRDQTVCPNCATRYVDPLSKNGWCVYCDSRRERTLESKRTWWRTHRGADAPTPDDFYA